MACARKCDICGQYYDAPEYHDPLGMDPNTSMIRMLRLNPEHRPNVHDVLHYDSCENCFQDVLDYILTKQADSIAK